MNDDGIDSHVPPLLSLSPGHRHQRMRRERTALQQAIRVSATWCCICWYVVSRPTILVPTYKRLLPSTTVSS